MNHREVLGVGNNANRSDIKSAFREAAKSTHPDVNSSPEAAEAFAKIKQAHDALLQELDGTTIESSAAQDAAMRAAQAVARAAYQTPPAQTSPTNTARQKTDEEIRLEQELDARAAAKQHPLHRRHESEEVVRHRKKLRTNAQRINGKY